MKIILACEGESEVDLIQSLIDKKILCFKCEIFMDMPIVIRQLSKFKPLIDTLSIDEEIIIYRIGDTLKDKIDYRGFELRKKYIKEYKICTKPEIEILIIINEGWYKEFINKHKNIKPKGFVNSKFKNFDIKKYFQTHNMLNAIVRYNKIKKKKKNEYTLHDLINKNI